MGKPAGGYKATEAIQVCYDLSNSETRDRELRGLAECMEKVGLSSGTIVSFDHEEIINLDGGRIINVVPAYQWLS